MLALKEFLFSEQDQALSFGEDMAVSNLSRKERVAVMGRKTVLIFFLRNRTV